MLLGEKAVGFREFHQERLRDFLEGLWGNWIRYSKFIRVYNKKINWGKLARISLSGGRLFDFVAKVVDGFGGDAVGFVRTDSPFFTNSKKILVVVAQRFTTWLDARWSFSLAMGGQFFGGDDDGDA